MRAKALGEAGAGGWASVTWMLLACLWVQEPALERVEPAQTTIQRLEEDVADLAHRLTARTYQAFFVGLFFALITLHLSLYLMRRDARENLYFVFFLAAYGGAVFFDYQHSQDPDTGVGRLMIRIQRVFMGLFASSALALTHQLFHQGVPKKVLPIVALLLGASCYLFFFPDQNLIVFLPLSIVAFSLVFIECGAAIRQGKEGALGITAAFGAYVFFSLFDLFMDLGAPFFFERMENPYAIGSIVLVFMLSIFTARRYANTYAQLLAQEKETQKKELERAFIEAEDRRKGEELDAARRLQLGMLPETRAAYRDWDVQFSMHTATEVGGDYFDYRCDDEGLTVCVGDATGHGMKAAVVVAAMKSLFHTLGDDEEPAAFLQRASGALKQMRFKNMFMALALIRFRPGGMEVAMAGMPPALVHRAEGGVVEEIRGKAPPLGCLSRFSYQSVAVTLNPGDTVLVMSDGLMEQFDGQGRMLGLTALKEALTQAPADTAEIIAAMEGRVDQWRAGRDRDDDMTLAAIVLLEG